MGGPRAGQGLCLRPLPLQRECSRSPALLLLLLLLHACAGINCLAVHQDAALLTLTGGEDGSVRICNVTAGAQQQAGGAGGAASASARVVASIDCERPTELPRAAPLCVALATDSCAALCGVAAVAAGHEDSVECVGWCKQAPLAASAGVDGFLRIWDVNVPSIERSKCEHPTVSAGRLVFGGRWRLL